MDIRSQKPSLLMISLIILLLLLMSVSAAEESPLSIRVPSRFGKRNNLFKFWKLCKGEGITDNSEKNEPKPKFFNHNTDFNF